MVLTLLSGTTNEYKFSYILGFRSLHKQMFSNCMRLLSIVDCFWFFHSVFAIHSIQEDFTEAVRIFSYFNVFQFPKAQHLQTKVMPQCVDLATNCEYKDLYSLPFQL